MWKCAQIINEIFTFPMRQDTSYVPTLFVQWTILLASNQFFNLVTYHFSQMLCYILLSTHIVVPKTDITMHWWKMVLMCKNWSLWSQVKSYLNRLMISYSGCKQWYLNFNYIKRWAKKLRFLYNEDIMEIIDNLISSHKLSPMSLPNCFLYISTFNRQFLLQAILS